MKTGAFTFVLHSHLPYCRNAGRWPHGEEWLHEAASETYIPLLDVLYDLKLEGCPFRLTLGITPVLLEQLADQLVLHNLADFLEEKVERARSDVKRFEGAGEGHLSYLAKFYLDRYSETLVSFNERFSRDLVGAFKRLQEEGYIEIAGGAATHAYLPLLERDSSIYAQLQVGKANYSYYFGRSPSSIWLPECGYRPAYYVERHGRRYVKPGLDAFLSELGIRCFFAETHMVEGGHPVGKAREEVIGPYANIPRRYVVPSEGYVEPVMRTTYLPYWVQAADVAVIGRNNQTSMQVWSADWGYPGDFNYREFHKRDGISGLHYWKITGAKLDLAYKELYDPYHALRRVDEHSTHFVGLVERLLVDFYQTTGEFGIIAAAYDAELFGHWWFEGIDWLKQVLAKLSRSETVEMTTASEYLDRHPPKDVLALPEGSWGLGGGHFTWRNVDTEWMWRLIHTAELRMEKLVSMYPQVEGGMKELLNQAARELLLLQASDWQFLVTTGQARLYAENRFLQHLGRFHQLADLAEAGIIDGPALSLCRSFWEADKVFPYLDYRCFADREGRGER